MPGAMVKQSEHAGGGMSRGLPAAVTLLALFVSGSTPPEVHRKEPAELSVAAEYRWTELTGSARFPGSYNFTLISTPDRMQAMHPSGTWSSSDGKDWTRSSLPSILNDAFLDYVYFKGAVYAPGSFEGNIEHFTWTSRISRSLDFRKWEVLAERSNLPQLYFYSSVVFQGRIWIIGGEYNGKQSGDVWNSNDGIHWKQVSTGNPWKRMAWSRGAVVFRERMFLFCGDGSRPVQVYSSADGIRWKLETTAVHQTPFWGATPVVYDGAIWLLGCNRNGTFSSDLLSSVDGQTWVPGNAPWSPRGGIAATVFGGALYITGGKYSTGSGENIQFVYSNDVWKMERIR
jgi:hypothetical protein